MQIDIRISYDPAQETLDQALEALGRKANTVDKPIEKTDLNVYAVPQGNPPALAKEEVSTPEVKPDEPPAVMPEAKSEEAGKKTGKKTDLVTKTDIRAIATAISKAGKKQELKAALESFGATKLSDVAEADYPFLKQKLEAINA